MKRQSPKREEQANLESVNSDFTYLLTLPTVSSESIGSLIFLKETGSHYPDPQTFRNTHKFLMSRNAND